MATSPSRRHCRAFTTETQLRRHRDFIESVYQARQPQVVDRRGRLSQVRALIGAVCSVIFSDIPPNEETRARVLRSRRRRKLQELKRSTVYQLLATRDLQKYLEFVEEYASLIKPFLSNLFTSCTGGGTEESRQTADEPSPTPPTTAVEPNGEEEERETRLTIVEKGEKEEETSERDDGSDYR